MSKYNEQRKKQLLDSLGLENGRNPIPMVKTRDSLKSGMLAAFAFTLVLLFYILFIPVRISGASMEPTLKNNQRILVRRGEEVRRFDVVVLKQRLTDDGDTKVVVKRVIGMPGDRVAVVDGKLYVNDRLYEEDYTADENTEMFDEIDFVIDVPKDHIFVMGDNRDVSSDSRALGSFKMDAVMGVKIGNKVTHEK